MTPPERERLPNRRPHEALDFSFSREAHGFGLAYTFGVGRYSDGRLAEVFVDCHKLASPAMDEARDAAVLVSLALQHGMPLSVAQAAFARFEDGRPCTLLGRLIDVLVEHDKAAPEPPSPRAALVPPIPEAG